MMNYLATGIVASFIKFNANSSSGTIVPLNTDTKAGWLPVIEFFNNSYIFNIIIVALVAAAIWTYLKYSKHGYELSVVGGSQNTAKYIGINVKKVIIRTVVVTGAVCGVVGFLLVAGNDHSVMEDMVGGRGFTAILICWIGNFNVPLMTLYSFLIASSTASSWLHYPNAISKVSTALFFVILIASSFFVNFDIHIPWLRKLFKKNEEKEETRESINEEKEPESDKEKAMKAIKLAKQGRLKINASKGGEK